MQVSRRIARQSISIAVILFIGAMIMPTAEAAPQRRLSVSDEVIVEGDDGSQALSFRITHTGKPTNGITVDYSTAAVSAMAGSDFMTASGRRRLRRVAANARRSSCTYSAISPRNQRRRST